MKSVLISIQPKWCELIANGKKTIEVRKTAPKLKTPFKCYIYMTKTNSKDVWCGGFTFKNYHMAGKVIGEFVCDSIDQFECHNELPYDKYNLSKSVLESMCLICHDVDKYGVGKPLYGWHISDLKIYDKPKELGEFKSVKTIRGYHKKAEPKIIGINIERLLHSKRVQVKWLTNPPQPWCYVEEPPCKVGDVVYLPCLTDWGEIEHYSVKEVGTDTIGEWFVVDDEDGERHYLDEIGKDCFLTKSQAEARLKELQEQENG